jgi:hypothetical protein
VRALITTGSDPAPCPYTTPLYIAAQHGLLEFYPLLSPALSSNGANQHEVLAFLRMQKDERDARRHELLVCIASARREQDAGRGDVLHPLLRGLRTCRRMSCGRTSFQATVGREFLGA